MTQPKKPSTLSDADLFRQTIGKIQPVKKNNRVHIVASRQTSLDKTEDKTASSSSILQNQSTPVRKPHNNNPTHSQLTEGLQGRHDSAPIKSPALSLKDLLMRIEDSQLGYTNKIHANLDQLSFNTKGSNCPYFRQLKKGLIPVEHEVDLHHLTLDEAKYTTLKHLIYAQQCQMVCIRIIHGKGNRSKEGYSPLKWATNHWLRQAPMVRAFCSCLPSDGGTGAVYVLLGQS